MPEKGLRQEERRPSLIIKAIHLGFRELILNIHIHPHARARMLERGASETEIIATVPEGEKFPAKFGRVGFRRNFQVSSQSRGRYYQNKQVEVYAVAENGWLVLTVMVKYF